MTEEELSVLRIQVHFIITSLISFVETKKSSYSKTSEYLTTLMVFSKDFTLLMQRGHLKLVDC
jgi:hypothetical protein